MNKKILLLLLLLVITKIIYSQKSIITGSVVDSENAMPVANAVFIVEATPVRVLTNENGEFYIDEKVPIGEYTASITKEGYVSRRFTIITKEGNKAALYNIRLKALSQKKKKKPEKKALEINPKTIVTGTIRDRKTSAIINDVQVRLLQTPLKQITDINGNFLFEDTVPTGTYTLRISKNGYTTTNHEVNIIGGKVGTIEGITLVEKISGSDGFTINPFALDELHTDEVTIKNTSGLYQNSETTFLRTAAYQFSPTFYQLRGQDASAGKILLNGIELNNVADGTPEWNAIAAQETARQNEEYTSGLGASNYAFGGQNGVLNINTLASEYSKGGKVSYLSTNRRFTHGINASYASGLMNNGWAFMISVSKRFANEGYYDGTSYDTNSLFVSVEKKLNPKHRLGFTGIISPTKRDIYTANTEEVYGLKGDTYNPYWGRPNGEIENYRSQSHLTPIGVLTHYWTPNSKVKIQTSVALVSEKSTNGVLDTFGSDIDDNGDVTRINSFDPNPTRPEKLPSFFLKDTDNPNQLAAAVARDDFVRNGQLDWSALFAANRDSASENASFILYDDITERTRIDFNSLVEVKLSENLIINGSLGYSYTNADNYAEVKDLLGTRGYLDINPFDGSGVAIQNDIENPNRIVRPGDFFKYNYVLETIKMKGFVQLRYEKEIFKTFVAVFANQGNYLRNGLFRNGASLQSSFGIQERSATDFGVKGGLNYQFTTEQAFFLNGRFASEAPFVNDFFYDAREHSNLIEPLGEILIPNTSSTTMGLELEYSYKNAVFEAQISAYYTSVSGARETSLFNGTTVGGSNSTYIKEVLVGLNKRYAGLEIGLKYKITEPLSINFIGALGDYQYTNNPQAIYVLSESEAIDLGEARISGTHIAAGPEIAISFGLTYKNHKNWWIAANANYFDNAYQDVNVYNRTNAFGQDESGTTIAGFTEENQNALLKQQKISGYFLGNLSGGKYWSINKNVIGLKINIHNVLGTAYRIGGYEQEGAFRYDSLLEDNVRAQPLFGSKVWAGYGTTYFANLYYRF